MIGFKSNKKGFGLIEIIIVVAIISILTLIVLPNVRRARIKANEMAAVTGLETIDLALDAYLSAYGGYPDDLEILAEYHPPITPLANAPPDYQSGYGRPYYGYTFTYSNTPNSYTCESIPVESGITGNNDYRITESGVIEIKRGGSWEPL